MRRNRNEIKRKKALKTIGKIKNGFEVELITGLGLRLSYDGKKSLPTDSEMDNLKLFIAELREIALGEKK